MTSGLEMERAYSYFSTL